MVNDDLKTPTAVIHRVIEQFTKCVRSHKTGIATLNIHGGIVVPTTYKEMKVAIVQIDKLLKSTQHEDARHKVPLMYGWPESDFMTFAQMRVVLNACRKVIADGVERIVAIRQQATTMRKEKPANVMTAPSPTGLTCAVCRRAVQVRKDGMVRLHGYRTINSSHTTGCTGSGFPPWEESSDGLRSHIRRLQVQLEEQKSRTEGRIDDMKYRAGEVRLKQELQRLDSWQPLLKAD